MVNELSEKKIGEMIGGSSLVLRASIVFGMVAAVLTILYLTPLPDQNFKSCDRPCHKLDWPMICRVKLYIESIPTHIICQDCLENKTNCIYPFCETETSTRGILLANRQIPAPPIHVCHNDILVVDIINNIPGHSLTMHWRGQSNNEAPFMDGVPMVTQCPIPSYTTFQYKFRASSAGTHLYHAFSDTDRTRGLHGALVVRQADKVEPHRKLYDIDSKDHIVVLSEWNKSDGKRSGIMINGKGITDGTSQEVFKLKKGKRHRFRVIYAAGTTGCPITLSVDSHLLKVIAVDGNSITPHEVASIQLSKGERIDFILKANQEANFYIMRTRSSCGNNNLFGEAVVSYLGANVAELSSTNSLDFTRDLRTFDTSFCKKNPNKVCLDNVKPVKKIEDELKTVEVDKKIYMGFDSTKFESQNGGDNLPKFHFKAYRMNNITFTYSSVPLLTQPDDIVENMMCNAMNIPERCWGKQICECVHIEHLPLGSIAEIILFDQGSGENEHIFHLHGYQFYVIGSKIFERPLTKEEVIKMDKDNKLVERNLVNPVLKDTIRVPENGVVVLKFFANNPGFWMLRDEQSNGWTRGLDVVIQVGGIANVVATPTNFPVCGNFIGPEFFLL